VVPKGFFPVQDTGVILGISRGARRRFEFCRNGRAAAGSWSRRDSPGPAMWISLSSFIGVDGTNTTPNSGRIQIT
jgi:multidrug efflux pump